MIEKRKGIIIVDMPDDCRNCRFYYLVRDWHTGKYAGCCRMIPNVTIYDSKVKPDQCPIKPMPSNENY